MAINEDVIVDAILGGVGEPVSQIVSAGVLGYHPTLTRYPYNPEKAKELLAEAGYPEGFEMTLDGPPDRYAKDEETLLAAASYWGQIGVKVSVRLTPAAAYWPKVRAGEFPNFMIGWAPSFGTYCIATSYNTYDPEKGLGTWNVSGYSNPEVDRLLEEAIGTFDVQEREALYHRVLEIVKEEVPQIPLHTFVNVFGKNKNLGFAADWAAQMRAYNMWWK